MFYMYSKLPAVDMSLFDYYIQYLKCEMHSHNNSSTVHRLIAAKSRDEDQWIQNTDIG